MLLQYRNTGGALADVFAQDALELDDGLRSFLDAVVSGAWGMGAERGGAGRQHCLPEGLTLKVVLVTPA